MLFNKIKKGQIVYFYKSVGQYEGTILSGAVIAITKDLVTNKVTYKEIGRAHV